VQHLLIYLKRKDMALAISKEASRKQMILLNIGDGK